MQHSDSQLFACGLSDKKKKHSWFLGEIESQHSQHDLSSSPCVHCCLNWFRSEAMSWYSFLYLAMSSFTLW